MITRFVGTALLLTATFASALAAEPEAGSFYSITDGEEANTAEVQVGDVVELRVTFGFSMPNAPGDYVKLKVESGAEVSLLAVTKGIPKGGPLLVGQSTISALVMPKKAGTNKVTVTPIRRDGKAVKPLTFTLKTE